MNTEHTRPQPPTLADVATEAAAWAAWHDEHDVARIVAYTRGRLTDPDVTAGNADRPMDHYRVTVTRTAGSRARPARIRVAIGHPRSPVTFHGSAEVRP
jgi:hypothetical protein